MSYAATKLPANQHEIDDLKDLLRATKTGVRAQLTYYDHTEEEPGYAVLTVVDECEEKFLQLAAETLWAREASYYSRSFALRELVLDLVDGGWADIDSEAEYYQLATLIGAALTRTEDSPVYTERKFNWEE